MVFGSKNSLSARLKAKKVLSLLVAFVFLASIINAPLVIGAQYDLKYDSAGNLIEGLNQSYVYDGFNQLRQVRDRETGRVVEEYWYGHDGGRIKKTHYNEDGTEETFYYIGNSFVRKINGTATTDTNYYYLGSELVAKKENGQMLFFHPDNLGSTSLITDESGNAVEKTAYLPFGEVDEGGTLEARLYTGKELDNTALMYYGARYYSPFIKQFIQPDTILPDIYDPQQLNRYAYVRNNPYKYTDPSGNFIDIIADFGFIGYDLWTIFRNPGDWSNWAALGADVVGAVIPGATGLGMGVRAAAKANKARKAGDAARAAQKAYKAASKTRNAGNAFDSVKKGSGSRAGSSRGGKTGAVGGGKAVSGEKSYFSNIDDLHPSQPNLDRTQVDAYKKSIGDNPAFLENNPIRYIDSPFGGKVVTDGHHRLAAAAELGIKQVPVQKAPEGSYGFYSDVRRARMYDEAISDSYKYADEFWRQVSKR